MPLDAPEYAHLRDMLDYARRVTRLVAGLSFEAYMADEARQMAVERGIEIIGEAANRTSVTTRALCPEVSWKTIIGQRNVLAHQYGKIQQQKIWDAATISTPALIRQLLVIIPDAPDASALPWNRER